MNHTPGPWDFFVGNANGRGLIRIEASVHSEEAGHHIASMPRGKISESNARLIAAAPEMLEALMIIFKDDYHNDFQEYTKDSKEQMLIKAIELATGLSIEEVMG